MPPMPSGDMPGHGNMPGMTGMPMPTASGMPGMSGMMSDGDMAALRNAQGVEASKLFLTQMMLGNLIFMRPAQLGISFYKDAGATGEQATCRRCGRWLHRRSR